MKILQLDVKGFRSLKDISWKPGDLNILIGPNGSGKSNLLRMLEMISASAKGELANYVRNSGGMNSITWDGSSENITFKIKTTPHEGEQGLYRDPLCYELDYANISKTGTYYIRSESLADYSRVEDRGFPEPFKLLERKRHSVLIFDEKHKQLKVPEESITEEETALSVLRGPFIENHHIPQYAKNLSAFNVYHDIDVSQYAEIRHSTGIRFDKIVESDGKNLITIMHTLYTSDKGFKENIDAAMNAAFDNEYEGLLFHPAADDKIQLRIQWRSLQRAQPTADLSDGTLRFLILLSILCSPEAPPVIAIDEPEIGLHPSMMRIIAEFAVDAARRSQIIFTTHSPQFLDAFNDASPVITVLKNINGGTVLKNMEGEEFDRWLKEYSLGELVEEFEDSI